MNDSSIRPLISIIIPTRNSGSRLPSILRSIGAQTYGRYEVIIVDNTSTDSTIKIAREYGCRILSLPSERSAARNKGANIAKGSVLLFVDSDMELSSTVLEECENKIRTADALCIREVTLADNYWSRVRAFEQSRYFKSNLFEAARCFRRNVFEKLDGYDPFLIALEDYDLHARFLDCGFRLEWVQSPIYHHEEGLRLFTYLAKRRYYGTTDEIYLKKQPLRSRTQLSIRKRLKYILKYPPKREDLPLIPGFAVMRGLEWLTRK